MDSYIVFPLAYIIFLVLATFGYILPETSKFLTKSFHFPTATAYILTLAGVVLFYLASRWGKKADFNFRSDILIPLIFFLSFLTLQLTFPDFTVINFMASFIFVVIIRKIPEIATPVHIVHISLGVSILCVLITLTMGIPLLNANLRESVAVSPQRALFHGFGMLAASLGVAYLSRTRALAIVSLLAVAGVIAGFKSDGASIVLASVLTGLLLQKLKWRDILALLGLAGIFITAVASVIAVHSYSSWKIPFYLYPFYRAGFTFGVFSRITEIALPLGVTHGHALLDVTQKITSRVVLGYEREHIITSTLLGPAVLDFGIPGIITAPILGFYTGIMERLAVRRFTSAVYAMALTHLLILIEVGLQPTSVLYLCLLLYLSRRWSEF